jgi:glycosyltransferase 2 family protein
MRHKLKAGLHWCGSILAIAGTVFVVLRLREYGGEIDLGRFGMTEWLVLVALALIYGLSNLTLAMAWWNLLQKFSANVSRRWAIRTYGISQIAKYVPGNIFHLAGRQTIGMAAGLPAWPLAKSAIWELGLLALAAAIFSVLAIPLTTSGTSILPMVIVFVLAVSVTAGVLQRYTVGPVAIAFAWHVLFLAVSAAIFAGLVELLSPLPDVSLLPALGGAYVLAWLAGFATPGAPAGLGVREFVLLFLLHGLVDETDLLLAIVLGRIVTVCGDCVFSAITALMRGGTYPPGNSISPT